MYKLPLFSWWIESLQLWGDWASRMDTWMNIQRDYYPELPVIPLLSLFSPSGMVGSAVRFIYVCVNEGLALCREGHVRK